MPNDTHTNCGCPHGQPCGAALARECFEAACVKLQETVRDAHAKRTHPATENQLCMIAAVEALPDRTLFDQLPEHLAAPLKTALAHFEVHFAAKMVVKEIEIAFPELRNGPPGPWMKSWRPSDPVSP